jgi:hypothetical protein
MLLPFNINVNVNGLPCLRSTAVTVSATEVRFDFNSHRNVGRPFVGVVVVQLAQAIPDGTTTTLPVLFTTEGGNPANITTYDGANVTVADIAGTGIYLVWVDTQSGVVQLLTGAV